MRGDSELSTSSLVKAKYSKSTSNGIQAPQPYAAGIRKKSKTKRPTANP
jgi:hypothetical protein